MRIQSFVFRKNGWQGCLTALLCSFLLVPILGCVSKTKAKIQARAAYLAGQQEVLMRMQQNGGPGGGGASVRINGPVQNPIVPWTPDLTLAAALLAAGYQDNGTTPQVFLVHNGAAERVDGRILAGEDIHLQPGDIVQVVPQLAQPNQRKPSPGP